MNIRLKAVKYSTELRLYMLLLITNSVILITDSITWFLNGTTVPFLSFIFAITTCIYYILNPVICMFWSLYVDFQINHDDNHIKKLLLPLSIPLFFSTLISILSLFGDFFFYIDAAGFYQRGRYFMTIPVICFSYLAFTMLYVMRNRKRIYKPYVKSFILFAIPPYLGTLFQIKIGRAHV